MDVLFSNVTCVTMDAEMHVYPNAFVGVTDGKISHVGLSAPEEKPKAAPKQDTQTRWTKQQKRGLWVLAFCVCIALYYCGAFDSTGTPQIGDRVVVVNTTWGTLDKDNDELGDAMVARDAIGIYEQTSSGKAKHIWQGSHGIVIHGSWTKVQVRFDDGTLYWIPTEAVKKE